MTTGSGNVFADLGLPDAEDAQFQSDLAIQIRILMEQQHLPESVAAERMHLTGQELDAILNGQLQIFSVMQLLNCLTRLGRSVEVRISSEERAPEDAHLSVVIA